MANNKDGEVECFLTHQEIADILTERGYPMTSKVAWHLERQAFKKIASHPVVRQIAKETGFLDSEELEST